MDQAKIAEKLQVIHDGIETEGELINQIAAALESKNNNKNSKYNCSIIIDNAQLGSYYKGWNNMYENAQLTVKFISLDKNSQQAILDSNNGKFNNTRLDIEIYPNSYLIIDFASCMNHYIYNITPNNNYNLDNFAKSAMFFYPDVKGSILTAHAGERYAIIPIYEDCIIYIKEEV